MHDSIEIVEVSPRDGLQSQPQVLDTETKLAFIKRLIEAGVRRLEVASFVNPKRVPQMADAEQLIQGLPRNDDVRYIGLVLNARGFERAVDSKIDEINCVVVASDTFNQRNQGATTEQTMAAIEDICRRADDMQIPCGVTIGAAFGCPFEGEVPVSQVVNLTERLVDHSVKEIALADTIGAAGPSDVGKLLDEISKVIGNAKLRCHFHNTRNTGIANAYVAVQEGVSILDSSCGGVGGCPFAPAATGNVATEDVLYMLERMGMKTGIDIKKIMETTTWLEGILQTDLPAMVTKAGLFPSGELAELQ